MIIVTEEDFVKRVFQCGSWNDMRKILINYKFLVNGNEKSFGNRMNRLYKLLEKKIDIEQKTIRIIGGEWNPKFHQGKLVYLTAIIEEVGSTQKAFNRYKRYIREGRTEEDLARYYVDKAYNKSSKYFKLFSRKVLTNTFDML